MIDRNVLFSKMDQLQRHLARVKENNQISYEDFIADRNISDILLFNIGQAIQNCIDIAAHVVSDENLGIAGSNTELFELLQENSFIDLKVSEMMIKVVGFRNVIAHEYIRLDWERAYQVVTHRYRDLELFAHAILRKYGLIFRDDRAVS